MKTSQTGLWYRLWPLFLALSLLLAACGLDTRGDQAPTSITLTVTGAGSTDYTVAVQLGNGSWAIPYSNPSHTYILDLNGHSKYGVAVYCNQDRSLHLVHATSTELSSLLVVCGYPHGGSPSPVHYTFDLDVSQTGAQAGDVVVVWGHTITTTTVTSPYSVQAVSYSQEGTRDMLITVEQGDPDRPLSRQVLHAEVLRNVNIINRGSSLHTLGTPLGTNTVTISNLPQGFYPPSFIPPHVAYASKDNKGAGVVGFGSGAASFTYRQVRGFSQGDRYLLTLVYEDTSGNSAILYRKGFTGGNVSVILPSPWASKAIWISGSAHPQIAGLNRTDTNLKAYRFSLYNSNYDPNSVGKVNVLVTKGWLGSNTTFTIPDLSWALNYTPFPLGSNINASISAVFSPNPLRLGLGAVSLSDIFGPNDINALTADLDIALAIAGGSYTVGGGPVRVP